MAGRSGRRAVRRHRVLGRDRRAVERVGAVNRSYAWWGSASYWKRLRPSRSSVAHHRDPGRKALRCWCTYSSRRVSGVRFT